MFVPLDKYAPFPAVFSQKWKQSRASTCNRGKNRCIFIGRTTVVCHSREVTHWRNTYSFTTQYLLRDLLHNSLQVTKFSLLICRSVYIAWCSFPSSIVGWSGVPTRFRTIWIFKVKCSRVTFLPADWRNVAFFTTHTSLVFRYLL